MRNVLSLRLEDMNGRTPSIPKTYYDKTMKVKRTRLVRAPPKHEWKDELYKVMIDQRYNDYIIENICHSWNYRLTMTNATSTRPSHAPTSSYDPFSLPNYSDSNLQEEDEVKKADYPRKKDNLSPTWRWTPRTRRTSCLPLLTPLQKTMIVMRRMMMICT